jgi:hypothetical protein
LPSSQSCALRAVTLLFQGIAFKHRWGPSVPVFFVMHRHKLKMGASTSTVPDGILYILVVDMQVVSQVLARHTEESNHRKSAV